MVRAVRRSHGPLWGHKWQWEEDVQSRREGQESPLTKRHLSHIEGGADVPHNMAKTCFAYMGLYGRRARWAQVSTHGLAARALAVSLPRPSKCCVRAWPAALSFPPLMHTLCLPPGPDPHPHRNIITSPHMVPSDVPLFSMLIRMVFGV